MSETIEMPQQRIFSPEDKEKSSLINNSENKLEPNSNSAESTCDNKTTPPQKVKSFSYKVRRNFRKTPYKLHQSYRVRIAQRRRNVTRINFPSTFRTKGRRIEFNKKAQNSDKLKKKSLLSFIRNIKFNLIPKEKHFEARDLKQQLLNLTVPLKPLSPYYKLLSKCKEENAQRNLYEIRKEASTKWRFLEKADKTKMFHSYQSELKEYRLLCLRFARERRRLEDALLCLQGITPKRYPRLTPFRMFRKELAPKLKATNPNLNSKDKQLLLKAQWHHLSQNEKKKYVIKSKLDSTINSESQKIEALKKALRKIKMKAYLDKLDSFNQNS